MGALPDHQPRPTRTPDQAPPLQVVPARTEATPQESAPAVEPTPPEDPETPGEQAAPAWAGATETDPPVPQESAGEPDEEPEDEQAGGLDLDRIAAWRTWAAEHLRPPDLVHQASPGLKELWEQATRGEHLPENAALQVAERARLAVSLPVIAAAVLLAWAMVSPARQAALLAAAGAVWVLGSVLLSALAELL